MRPAVRRAYSYREQLAIRRSHCSVGDTRSILSSSLTILIPPGKAQARGNCNPMESYDPYRQPTPEVWRDLGVSRSIELVREYHRQAGLNSRYQGFHAAMHVIVEGLLAAEGKTEVKNTLTRLVDDGLDRHQAIHALASVVEHIMSDMNDGTVRNPESFQRALDNLKAKNGQQ